MKALKFTLSGNSAFFKDNVINTVYLTYGNIHRVALLVSDAKQNDKNFKMK